MPSSSYRPEIDGLRAVAVIAVLIYHAFPGHAPGGFTGVDVFFVISGYLITGILAKSGGLDIAGFYRRRIRRIFPGLCLVLIAVMAAGSVLLLSDDFAELGRETAAGAGFVVNLYYWSQVSYFDVAVAERPLLHLWSLGVEEQFYIVWPVLVWACRRKQWSTLHVIGAIAALSLALTQYLTWTDPTAAFYSPMTRLWELGAGGLLALHPVELKPGRANLLALAGALLVLGGFAVIDDTRAFPGLWALLPVAGTAMIIASPAGTWVNRLLALRPFVWIGLISYPLYLWHWPLLSFATIENHLLPPAPMVRLALLAAAFALSVATYRLIERPLRRGPAVPLVAAMALILFSALAVVAARGLPSRAVNHDPRKAFVAAYDRLHRHGLSRYYREECDFVFWGTLTARESISPQCTRSGIRGTDFLWGDSHAQALSFGLRATLPAGRALAQVATSGCHPWFPEDRGGSLFRGSSMDIACARSNRFALDQIARLRPDTVYLAQAEDHQNRDWDRLAAALVRMGVRQVVLVGPVPQWKPSLPEVVAAHEWPLRRDYVSVGLDPAPFRTDAQMRRRRMANVRYVSLIERLCSREGCLARIGGSLTAVDYGHLSPAGSTLVGRYIVDRVAGNGAKSAS